MKRLNIFIAVVSIVLTMNSVCSQTVSIDNTFGQNGRTIISNTTEISFLDFDARGNIIAVGYTLKGGGKYDLTIAKTNADGIIDGSFGNGGLVKITDYDNSMPYGLKITNDNKIIVIGSFAKVQFLGSETLIMRFNENGSIDENFGDSGKVNFNFNSGITSLNFDNDDFMLIAKRDYQGGNQYSYIVKYNYEGEIDEDFGENGTAYLTNSIYPYCMKTLNNGAIIFAGTYNTFPDAELGLCKLTPNGDLDTTFSNGGIWHKNVMQDFDLDREYFNNILEDKNGNLLLSGSGFTWGNRTFLTKFSSNGILDTNFGENGFYCFDSLTINKPIFQIGDKYLTAGYNTWYGLHQVAIVNNDGTSANVAYTSEIHYFQDMKLQGNNKIILGGGYIPIEGNFVLERIKLNSETSIKPYPYFDNSVTIFPNPANETLYFSTEKQIEIIDIFGRMLLKTEKPVKSIDISHLTAGMYFIKFDDNKVEKFLKH